MKALELDKEHRGIAGLLSTLYAYMLLLRLFAMIFIAHENKDCATAQLRVERCSQVLTAWGI